MHAHISSAFAHTKARDRYVHMKFCACIFMHASASISIHIHACKYKRVHELSCIQMQACAYAFMHASVSVCMHFHACSASMCMRTNATWKAYLR